jgi:hypothetical protein
MKEYARGVGKGAGDEAQRDNREINEYVKEFEKRISYINNPPYLSGRKLQPRLVLI